MLRQRHTALRTPSVKERTTTLIVVVGIFGVGSPNIALDGSGFGPLRGHQSGAAYSSPVPTGVKG